MNSRRFDYVEEERRILQEQLDAASSEAKRGRPSKPKDVRKLVIKMALENPTWGGTKIYHREAA
jgi:hypothetical protein